MPGIVAERASEQVMALPSRQVRKGNGPGGRRLGRGEMVPLTAEQSACLGELFEQFNDVLVAYARRKLMNWRGLSFAAAASLAEDIAQEAWVKVARTGADDLLRPGLTRDEALPRLYVRVQNRITAHFQLFSSAEAAVDWEDDLTCKALCPMMPVPCALAELPEHLRRMLAKLPERERQALTLSLDGLAPDRIGEHMGCSLTSAARLVSVAVLMVRIANPGLNGPAVDAGLLPGWQREALDRLDPVRRAVVLRLDDFVRPVLLTLLHGATNLEASERLGLPLNRVKIVSSCVRMLRTLTADDLAVAA